MPGLTIVAGTVYNGPIHRPGLFTSENMLFRIFNANPVLDSEAVSWLFESYRWALVNFDRQVFFNETMLVLPTNDYFPGRVDNMQAMAELIFNQVKEYAGLAHWPTRLLDHRLCLNEDAQPRIRIEGDIRGKGGIRLEQVRDEEMLLIQYSPDQLNNPEALIAGYIHTLAHYLATTADEMPPGGKDYWPQATELLAIFMGFGVIMANSAYTFKSGGCGSCGGSAQRTGYLNQYESTYALAIFCVLKNIPQRQVLPQLKKSLRGHYKAAIKEISQHPAYADMKADPIATLTG